ncbi:hypothetical protein AMELA_G00183890 [Ameiurus melas]|uniref:Uncharacterized protein n=1 Tax=Ameiurus melas TaxID=219545 RepID=A0A7J6AAI0_AMEME|nr:hypothetical protein AMELA_G00183890 [Ameiurus melas]
MLTPQCVGTNKLGVTSQVFFSILNKAQCSDAGPDVNISSVLIGVAVGASVMMILCGVFLCVRKASPLQSGPGDSAGFDTVEDEEFVYSNKTVLSESLHYSTVVFPNGEGSEIRGLSKLTADYAVIRHSSEHLTEGGVSETAIEEVQEVMGTNMEQEEATYGNITRPSDDGAN